MTFKEREGIVLVTEDKGDEKNQGIMYRPLVDVCYKLGWGSVQTCPPMI